MPGKITRKLTSSRGKKARRAHLLCHLIKALIAGCLTVGHARAADSAPSKAEASTKEAKDNKNSAEPTQGKPGGAQAGGSAGAGSEGNTQEVPPAGSESGKEHSSGGGVAPHPSAAPGGSQAPASAAKQAPRGEATPIPRYVLMPAIKLTGVEGKGAEPLRWNFGKQRFSMVLVLGSWNRRSADLTVLINEKHKQLMERYVGVVGVFSHDTQVAFEEWRKLHKPLFLTGLASSDFIDALSNPKVPTLWLVNHRGEVLWRQELPTNKDLEKAFAKVFTWTDF